MSSVHPAPVAPRLREAGHSSLRAHGPAVEAEVYVAPPFWLLLVLAVAAVLLQATLLAGLTLRGASMSLLTVLIVWTGMRCGVWTGGWLGLLGGLLEDALGGGGANVLGATLVGFGAGMLSSRFFSDSIPVFVAAVAGATIVRTLATLAVTELALGERGLFHRVSHEMLWQIVLNCIAAAIVLLAVRVASHAWPARVR